MKKGGYSTFLIIMLVLIIISCKKENTSADTRLRLSKTADNESMVNPTSFEYNSKGLLSRVSYGDNVENGYYNIIYNSNGQPIMVYDSTYYAGSFEYLYQYTIEWISKGFRIDLNVTSMDYNSTYVLNSQNQIIKIVQTISNIYQSSFDTTIITYLWAGSKVTEAFSYPADSTRNCEANCEFGTGNSPYKGINISLLPILCNEESNLDIVQNTYCITKYIDNIFNITVKYNFNAQNYPVYQDAEYKSYENGILKDDHLYWYFEYESY